MNAASLALRQVRYENRSFWRNPAAAFFTIFFPLMFLVIFNLLFGNDDVTFPGGSVSGSTFYVPAIAAFSLITACYTNLAMSITFSRDEGVLKRKRGTPLPTLSFLGGRILHSTLIGILMVVVVTSAGALFYGVDFPTDKLPALIVTVIIGAASFCALGLAITSVIPNAEAAPAVVNITILPLLFVSGIFIPLDDAPEWLGTLTGVFPIKHFADAMRSPFNPFLDGSGFEWGHLAVIAIWGLAGLVLAARFFSWEPRR